MKKNYKIEILKLSSSSKNIVVRLLGGFAYYGLCDILNFPPVGEGIYYGLYALEKVISLLTISDITYAGITDQRDGRNDWLTFIHLKMQRLIYLKKKSSKVNLKTERRILFGEQKGSDARRWFSFWITFEAIVREFSDL